jgi:serine/threonine protein kinase
MKNVILAEPGVVGLFGLAFILFLFVLIVLGVIAILAFALLRRNKTTAQLPPPPAPTATQIIPPKCPKCDAPMPPDSPEGLCPRCLITMNLATQTEITGEPAAAKSPPGPPLPVADIAKLFPQLEILECLGRGGMGAVYKARQPRLDRIVALKILSPEKAGNQKFAERFEREARALAKLHHPNVVTVYDFGETQGNFYLLMEFVDGLNLRQLLHGGKLSPPEALVIVPKICEALQYAHGLGIVHRDIKPENILIDKDGRVKIADFGIAKILGDGERNNLTEEQAIGTPHYMSPEQIEKPQSVDHRADIYSLGVVFYEMLTGELPLGKFQPPSKKVQVDVRLDEVVLRALEKEPERRYQQASEVKTQVENIAASGPDAGASAPGQAPKKPDHFWRWFAAICFSLIALPVLIAIVGILLAIAIPAFIHGRQEALKLRNQQIENSEYSVGQLWFPLGDNINISSIAVNGNHLTVKGHYNLASHPDALLKLDVTSDKVSGMPDDPVQSMRINQGSGDFELTMTRTIPGVPHVSMYADGHSFAARYFGTKDEIVEEQKLYIAMMTDPVALWLPTGIGSTADDPNGHNGTMENVTFTDGVIGSAFAFHPESNPPGAYSGIKIPDDPAFAVTDAFSIEGWIRPTGLGYIIFWRGDQRPGLDPYTVSMDDTRLKFVICDEANNSAQVEAQISYNQWWHFAAVFDNGTMTLYTNGVCAAETDTPIRPFANLVPADHPGIGIGNLNDGGNNFPFRGDIDDLAFYNRALSPLEVRFNYEIGFKPFAGPQQAALKQLQESIATEGNPASASPVAPQPPVISPATSLPITAPGQNTPDSSAEILSEQPPIVVQTFPISGARDVPPGETEIRVRFSKDMADGSWSWSTAWENSTPESLEPPHYLDDHRTCVIKVRLEPGKTYAWWLNSNKFHNFKDEAGLAAVPYLLIFQTKTNNQN